MGDLSFVLPGQLPSGKNQQQIRVVGHRIIKFPNARFKHWRATAWNTTQVARGSRSTFHEPLKVTVAYYPGDRLRRDVAGMMDALSHLLEWCPIHGGKKVPHCKMPFVRDDSLLVCWDWTTYALDRARPRAEVQLRPV